LQWWLAMFICSTKFIQIQMQIKFIPRCGGGGLQLLQLQVVVVQLHAGSRPIGHGSR
jgi:hypothetical protein